MKSAPIGCAFHNKARILNGLAKQAAGLTEDLEERKSEKTMRLSSLFNRLENISSLISDHRHKRLSSICVPCAEL